MTSADNTYSRFVVFAKIALPLIALGLLSTMFLFSRSIDPSAAIPFSDIDVEQLAREQRLVAPRFSGVTSDGSSVSVIAQTAIPDATNPRIMAAEVVQADIVTTSGLEITVTANGALYDGERDELDLAGDVEFTTSTGFVLRSDKIIANIAQFDLNSPGPVEGKGPTGRLEAGSMELRGASGSQLLVLKNGVKLIYQPQDQR